MLPDRVNEGEPLHPFLNASPRDKLENILRARRIFATAMPHLPRTPRAVCFTECIWAALVEMSDRYSPYGLVFSKRVIFERGGGPALYVRGDAIQQLGNGIPQIVEPFIQPFDPEGVLVPGTPLDWIHEREWRLPQDLAFEDGDVEYVIVDSLSDAERMIDTFGTDRIPKSKVLVMEMYRTIKATWGDM